MQQIILKTYQDQPIHFDLGDEIMINFTEMCKPFGKQPKDFFKTGQTQDFIVELYKSLILLQRDNNLTETKSITYQDVLNTETLLKIVNGGKYPGTWIHRKIAIKAAAWLNPAFEVWMIDQIETLLTQGSVTLSNNMLQQMQINLLHKQQREIDILRQDITEIKTQLNNMACMKNSHSLDIFALDLAQYIEHTCGRLYDQGIGN